MRPILGKLLVELLGDNPLVHSDLIDDTVDFYRSGLFEAQDRWSALNRPELTFAVNYRQNLDLISRIFEKCLPEDPHFSLERAKEWMGAMEVSRP